MPQRSTTRRRHGVATAATAVVALTAMLDGGSALAAGQVPAGPASGDFSQVHPHYVRLPMKDAGATSAKAAVATGTVRAAMVANPALPLFAHSFVSGGKTYSYAMVGTDPLGPAATSTIADTVTSVSFVVGTETISPSWAGYSSVLNSALFRPTALPGGTGQYGDVFLRNQFWGWLQTTKPAGMKNWHVKLAAPLTRPRITLRVPTGKGQVRTVHGVRLALVDATWFDTAVQAPVTAARADVFSQLLGGDVVLCHPYTTALTGCGIGEIGRAHV